MEPKNKEIIRGNLPKLIDETICSAQFLAFFVSKVIFSKSDIQLIKTEETNKGQLAASSRFYELLVSRSGSYDVLLEALKETNQSGALTLLDLSKSSENPKIKTSPTRFNSNSPKYITDYVNQPRGRYLIVSSHDCKLTCDWILESTANCKLYSINELLEALSGSQEPLDKQCILLANLEDNLIPIYTIRQDTQIKVVLVTQFEEASKLQEKLPDPLSAWKLAEDNIQWSDLNSRTQLKITTSVIQSLDLKNGKDLTHALSNVDTKFLIDLLNEKYPKPEDLFCDTIPTPLSYYVTRTLQTRYVLTKEILNHVFYDEFVLFSCTERHTLSNMSQKMLIDSSSNLLRKKNTTSKFVFLDNEIDFDIISDKFPNYSIHLLKYESNEFVWRKSRGYTSSIRKYVAPKQRTLLESEFISEILAEKNSNPICISDTPGKGKSVLLANLAIEVRKKRKAGIVAFIEIKELIRNLKTEKQFSSHQITLCLSQFLSTSTLGDAYLSANTHYLNELMFDGFDEIDADDTEFAFESLSRIRSVFCDTRIWITSRPHMLPELESRLETLGYNITPFTKIDQILFLSSFWSYRLPNSDKQSLSTFAEQCLNTLKDSLGPTSEDIAGVPLQCLLIGEAYEDDAKRFVISSLSKTPTFSQQITCLVDLYQKLVEKKFENFQRRYNTNKLSKSEIFKAHFQLALQTLYPSQASKFLDMLAHSMSMQEIFDFGLIEAKSVLSAPTFLHRTFAEYFVALLASELFAQDPSDNILDLLFTYIMKTGEDEYDVYPVSLKFSKFQSYVTCYFLNTFIQKDGLILSETAHLNHLRSIADACIYQNLEKLFLKFVLVNNSKCNLINEDLIVKTVYWADVQFLNVVFKEYLLLDKITPIFDINCRQVGKKGYHRNHVNEIKCSDSEYSIRETPPYTLFHLAMRKGDYATVNYLVTNHFQTSLENNFKWMYNNLIYCLLEGSIEQPNWIIAEKKYILNYLAIFNKDFLISTEERYKMRFENPSWHPELVLEVWKICKEFYNKTNLVIQVFRNLSEKLSYENFYTFIKIVFSNMDAKTLEKLIRRTKLLKNICRMKGLNTDILNFLKDQCFSFCDISSEDKISLFKEASEYQTESILHWLSYNLAHTSQEIKILLTECLDNSFTKRAVDVLYSYTKRQNDLEGLPDFYEMFEFLFGHNCVPTLEHYFTKIHLVSFFIWKTDLKLFEKMDFETNLTLLINIGSSYFEQLVLKSCISKSDGYVLKLVWTTHVCSKLKKDLFASRFKLYTKDTDIQASDSSGNNLLHVFARNFKHSTSSVYFSSFLVEILSTKGFGSVYDNKCIRSVNFEHILEVLMENNLSFLQFNNNQQSPICLHSYNKYRYSFSKIILPVAERMINRKFWNIENIHQMFYLIIKSQRMEEVLGVYGWYSKFCESQNIAVSEVKVNFVGEQSNFLDAAVKSGNGDVVEFVMNVLKFDIPLLPPSPTCIHHSLQSNNLIDDNSEKYICCMAQIFPNEINRLVNQVNDKFLVPLSLFDITSDIVKRLHDFGANVNAIDVNGNTPLHFALTNELIEPDVVDQLIQCGSNVNALNFKMESPLLVLVRSIELHSFSNIYDIDSRINDFQLLINNNADPRIQDDAGNTIIHNLVQNIASANVFHRIVKMLILNNFGDVLDMQNKESLTPLQLADRNFYIFEKTRQLLKKREIFYSEV